MRGLKPKTWLIIIAWLVSATATTIVFAYTEFVTQKKYDSDHKQIYKKLDKIDNSQEKVIDLLLKRRK